MVEQGKMKQTHSVKDGIKNFLTPSFRCSSDPEGLVGHFNELRGFDIFLDLL